MESVIMLGSGVIIGAIITFIMWGLINGAKVKKDQIAADQRNHVISSLESKWSEVDSIVSAFKSGRSTDVKFHTQLVEQLEIINRLFKTHRHQMDIFFVKYNEKLIEEFTTSTQRYLRPGMPAHPAVGITINTPYGEDTDIFPKNTISETRQTPSPEASITKASLSDEQITAMEQSDHSGIQEELHEFSFQNDGSIDLKNTDKPVEDFIDTDTGIGAIDNVPAPQESIPFEAPVPPKTELLLNVPITKELSFTDASPATTDQEMPIVEEEYLPLRSREEPVSEELLAEPPSPLPVTAETPFSFSGRVTKPQTPIVAENQGMPMQYVPRFSPSAYTADEVVNPMTIYDVEAETIIADRSTILGAPPQATSTEDDKKAMGITGEDVEQKLNDFFGFK